MDSSHITEKVVVTRWTSDICSYTHILHMQTRSNVKNKRAQRTRTHDLTFTRLTLYQIGQAGLRIVDENKT